MNIISFNKKIMSSKKEITIYLKPTCTTCKKAVAILDGCKVEYNSIDYYKENLSIQELTDLIKKLKVEPKELLRKRAGIYSELGLEDKDLSLSDVVKLILKYPDLLQRPIVVRGDEVILARPAENIKTLID